MFYTLSDPFLRVAFWIGIGSFSLALIFGLQIIWLRLRLGHSRRQEVETITKWRPILNAAVAGCELKLLPVLKKREGIVFFTLWVHLHTSLRGNATTELNVLGYRLACDALARKLLDDGNRAERLLSVLVLGQLEDRQAWSGLMQCARKTDSTMSFYAARALLQIDDVAALEILTPDFIRREDWPISQVVTLLTDIRTLCEPHLISAMTTISPLQLLRALRIAEGLQIKLPSAMHEEMLRDSSVDLIIAALRVVPDDDLLGTIRHLASHEDWRVRVHVAKTLGRIGDSSDLDVLARLLMDSQWWVRYRAAEALVGLSSFVRTEVDLLLVGASDQFASEMLTHAIAEHPTS